MLECRAAIQRDPDRLKEWANENPKKLNKSCTQDGLTPSSIGWRAALLKRTQWSWRAEG